VALSAGESHAVFGVSLAAIDVQPVWIEIESQSERPRWFFPISVDPDYYPAGEVARRATHLSSATVGELHARLSGLQIKPFIEPGETASGFVYAHDDAFGAAPHATPRYNAEGDPYFTDGLRAVLFLSDSLIPMSDPVRQPDPDVGNRAA
jgi:hypothetical protein